MATRIMYIECKTSLSGGEVRIGRVTFSKTKRSVHYNGKTFLKVGAGYKYNHIDTDTGEPYWISGCKKNGTDRLYNESAPIYIDDDVREEYWVDIRNMPENKDVRVR